MGTFTPLVFGTNGDMGLDCQNFLKWYYDQKSFPVFLPILKVNSLNIELAKF